MATRESDIVYETGTCWVKRDRKSYTVFRTGVTHSTSDSAYKKNADGLSIAKARCDYLTKRAGSGLLGRTRRRRRSKPMTAAQLRDKLACKIFGGKACR